MSKKGRPPLADKDRRSEYIGVSLSAPEKKRIVRGAKSAGKGISPFIRETVLGQLPNP